MTRLPVPGKVKTRLAEELGDVRACEIHRELAEHAARRMRAAAASTGAVLEIHVAGGNRRAARSWLGRGLAIEPQRGEDLGQRLANAFVGAFTRGATAVVAVGSDCPDLGGVQVRAALAALRDRPVVLGPAVDGGYYLVGARADAAATALPALFSDRVPWGTDAVLVATLDALSRARLDDPALLEELADVDRPDDLAAWEAHRRSLGAQTISAIVPTLNEAGSLETTMTAARAAGVDEIVVADGGSSDETTLRARAAGAAVVTAARGRAAQMNAGAAAATGDVLCFVHADTLLPADACARISEALRDPTVPGGAFGFSAGASDDTVDRLISSMGQLRYRVFRLPYGDQAIFVRRQVFEDLGGFPDMPAMEDYEFARRLRRTGPLARPAAMVRTSTRAWREHGLVRSTIVNMAVIAGYRLGVSTDTLARWRKRASSRA